MDWRRGSLIAWWTCLRRQFPCCGLLSAERQSLDTVRRIADENVRMPSGGAVVLHSHMAFEFNRSRTIDQVHRTSPKATTCHTGAVDSFVLTSQIGRATCRERE